MRLDIGIDAGIRKPCSWARTEHAAVAVDQVGQWPLVGLLPSIIKARKRGDAIRSDPVNDQCCRALLYDKDRGMKCIQPSRVRAAWIRIQPDPFGKIFKADLLCVFVVPVQGDLDRFLGII